MHTISSLVKQNYLLVSNLSGSSSIFKILFATDSQAIKRTVWFCDNKQQINSQCFNTKQWNLFYCTIKKLLCAQARRYSSSKFKSQWPCRSLFSIEQQCKKRAICKSKKSVAYLQEFLKLVNLEIDNEN